MVPNRHSEALAKAYNNTLDEALAISLSNQVAGMAEEIVTLRRRVKILEKEVRKLNGLEEE